MIAFSHHHFRHTAIRYAIPSHLLNDKLFHPSIKLHHHNAQQQPKLSYAYFCLAGISIQCDYNAEEALFSFCFALHSKNEEYFTKTYHNLVASGRRMKLVIG
jgi:hypothetical protein